MPDVNDITYSNELVYKSLFAMLAGIRGVLSLPSAHRVYAADIPFRRQIGFEVTTEGEDQVWVGCPISAVQEFFTDDEKRVPDDVKQKIRTSGLFSHAEGRRKLAEIWTKTGTEWFDPLFASAPPTIVRPTLWQRILED